MLTHSHTNVKKSTLQNLYLVSGITLGAFTYPESLKILVTLKSVLLFPRILKAKLKGLCPK